MKKPAIIFGLILLAGTLVALPWLNERFRFYRVCVIPVSDICIDNLRQIDGAKMQWALNERKTTNDTPTIGDIGRFMKLVPSCPAGGVYTLGRMDENTKCSVKGHELPWSPSSP